MMLFTIYRANGGSDELELNARDQASEDYLSADNIRVTIVEEEFWFFTLVAIHECGVATAQCNGHSLSDGLRFLVSQIKSQKLRSRLGAEPAEF